MAKFGETISERIFREIRERDKLFDAATGGQTARLMQEEYKRIKDLQNAGLLPQHGAIAEAARQMQEVKRLQDTGLLPKPDAHAVLDAARSYTSEPALPALPSPSSTASPRLPASSNIGLQSVAELGAMVRKARKAMKMSQSEFADYAGVGRRFLSELENGKPSLEFDKVLACAKAAGIDLFARSRSA